MKPTLIPLKVWMDSAHPNLSEHDKKLEMAVTFECGISTIYRWIKDGNIYIEDIEASMAGDDAGAIVWEMKKSVFG